MKNVFLGVVTIVFIFFSPTMLTAQCRYDPATRKMVDVLTGNECINTIVTAVPFLRITPDSRAGGMGDAGIAVESDAGSLYNNASLLAFATKSKSISTTYSPWLRALGLTDVYMAYVAGYTKIGDLQAIGGSLRYFSLGNIDYTDDNGSPLGSGKPNEFEVLGSYSRKLSDQLSAAVSLKFIYSFLASDLNVGGNDIKPGVAGATDISFSYKKPIGDDFLTAGLALTNLGTKISYTKANQEYIPANLGIGVAYTWNFDEYNQLTLTGDLTKLLVPSPYQSTHPDYDKNGDQIPDYKQHNVVASWFKSFGDAPNGFREELQELMISVGTEYWYNNQFALRAGYFRENPYKGNRQYLTLGLGVKYNVFGMNLSYLVPTARSANNRDPLANTLRFSLIFDFEPVEP
ncbi:MAG: type IX secretion system outer membrane channel protein PorV [Saprospiraceae bacterium]|nr:type IX secretion system outer membrane channel protein PorV [Saprospiraceae bacterium]